MIADLYQELKAPLIIYPQDSSSGDIHENIDSSFTFTPLPRRTPSSSATDDYILDITKYIPVGCLRVPKRDCVITTEEWKSCDSWCAFAHPRDVYNTNGGAYLLNDLQEKLFSSTTLQPYRGLHNSGWIRMEFKYKDSRYGQARVYILPDDVGRAAIDRQQASLRRSMQLLLTQIDISKATWNGIWSECIPVAHVDPYLDGQKPRDVASLFHIYNTLPSPKPDPEIVADRYAREAIHSILDDDIEGLTTSMYTYQRRSAALMLQREAQPAQILDPRLRPVVDQKHATWYCDLDAGLCLREPRTYEAAKGGICAETMGLGKTLICLALIMATRDLSSQTPVEYSLGLVPVRKVTGSLLDMSAATIGRTGTPWKREFGRMEAEGYGFSQCREAIHRGAGYYYLPGPEPRRESRNPIVLPPRKIWLSTATIVVVPANLVQQWRQEIKKHTVGLKVLVMNSLRAKLPPAEELCGFDLILFSKQRFDREAKDGSDDMGRRRTTTSIVCRCPYIGSSRERDCNCFKEENVYNSPLKDIHFKRLITDEGHSYGNASRSSRTEAVTVVDFLQLSARWIVSGTPTRGLYGLGVAIAGSDDSSTPGDPLQYGTNEKSQGWMERYPPESSDLSESTESDNASETSSEQERLFFNQERQDLEKLGNIATHYLKARPWAKVFNDDDQAFWAHHVMQPRHSAKSHGNMDCLRATLEGMIIRHRHEDVMNDVTLPPLYQDIVYLDGSMQDKLALNMFSMMIVSNAVTSERKDADYLFHPRQQKALAHLVSNLRQASFFWSGFTADDVQTTINIAKKFLEEKEISVSPDDENLLLEAVKVGEIVLSNTISSAVSRLHEMPMYVQNECPDDIRAAWSLDGASTNPTLMGATMVHAAQKFIESQIWKDDPMSGMVVAGEKAMKAAHHAQNPTPVNHTSKSKGKEIKPSKNTAEPAPVLACGVTVGDGSTPKKRSMISLGGSRRQISSVDQKELTVDLSFGSTYDERKAPFDKRQQQTVTLGRPADQLESIEPKNSEFKEGNSADKVVSLDLSSPLASTSIVSTSSAKLSYLMDRIMAHYEWEKILVFYEADNVAYYIAQALECMGIKHLIYAKTLSSTRRAQYVVTFNKSETFRVLLMDVSQAAFGLDMSSASRVYFVNPVFDPQVAAQAVKRAHRIGQTKPVYVETLVLKGSIEEVVLERGKAMSNEEHNKCKNILDDQTMYNWIRNVCFLPVSADEVPGPEQMAKLETPQLVFAENNSISGVTNDPDADLLFDNLSPKAKGKRKGTSFVYSDRNRVSPLSAEATGKRRAVLFAGLLKEPIRRISWQDNAAESDTMRGRAVQPLEMEMILEEARQRAPHAPFTAVDQILKERMDDDHRRLAFAPSENEPSRAPIRRRSRSTKVGEITSSSASSGHAVPFYEHGASRIFSGSGATTNPVRRRPQTAKDVANSSASASTQPKFTHYENDVGSLVVKMKLGQHVHKLSVLEAKAVGFRQHLANRGYKITAKGWKLPPQLRDIDEDENDEEGEDEQAQAEDGHFVS